MDRSLQPELLDALPPDHPDARHNRRDLRLTNAVMRNHAWFERVLPRLVRPGEHVLEIGSGTGELVAKLARCGLTVAGLDLWPPPADWPGAQAWHRVDLRNFERWAEYPVVIGNLIFHQFADAELRELGGRLRGARVILACEPSRRRASQIAYATIAPCLGANHITLHDAHVSIAAGFRADELPHLLGLNADEWEIHCSSTLIGAYRMLAVRRP